MTLKVWVELYMGCTGLIFLIPLISYIFGDGFYCYRGTIEVFHQKSFTINFDIVREAQLHSRASTKDERIETNQIL